MKTAKERIMAAQVEQLLEQHADWIDGGQCKPRFEGGVS
jgi:hypothetical protein